MQTFDKIDTMGIKGIETILLNKISRYIPMILLSGKSFRQTSFEPMTNLPWRPNECSNL